MIKLINETPDIHKPYTGVVSVEIVIEDEASTTELIEAFEKFMLASGYTIPDRMHLDFVEEE